MSVSVGKRYFLLPWVLATAVVTLTPTAVLLYKRSFDIFHPLVFPVWTYFFPGFVIGGLVLAFGISEPYFLASVGDESYNLPLTFGYIIVGFLSLSLGFAVPFAASAGRMMERYLPVWNVDEKKVRTGGLVLLFVGSANILFAFSYGALGYQRPEEGSELGGLIVLMTLLWNQASFMLALNVFRSPRIAYKEFGLIFLLLMLAVATALFGGSRGGLVLCLLPIVSAFFFSGRKLRLRHYFLVGLLFFSLLAIGVVYGTTFRGLRGSQESVSLGEYAAIVPRTFEALSEQDTVAIVGEGVETLAARLELVSSLALVVANYEALAIYEEQFGIANNIAVDTFTFFIPRLLWRDKPISVDPANYGELYFNYSENSFTMTPIGDLLRNFGPIGVPIGMFILGLILRVGYTALLDKTSFSYWRLTIYYLLLTSISYDGTYGMIVPYLFKVLVLGTVGLLIVRLFSGPGVSTADGTRPT